MEPAPQPSAPAAGPGAGFTLPARLRAAQPWGPALATGGRPARPRDPARPRVPQPLRGDAWARTPRGRRQRSPTGAREARDGGPGPGQAGRTAAPQRRAPGPAESARRPRPKLRSAPRPSRPPPPLPCGNRAASQPPPPAAASAPRAQGRASPARQPHRATPCEYPAPARALPAADHPPSPAL
ncbi:sterile alpha motif domain-containing protein 1-like [Peromyscus californicus insignis]|uniref:sterile alpha motif domain-containing protein 1-like n=1 Tax=Peromyscus californicus insignis TaxID=564181 RepID=UPI0022A6B3FD|nr:sterile alpha motif domain-containing protein 1-like [Peromyscus californicus insignis]